MVHQDALGLVVPGVTDLRPLGRGGFGAVYSAWQVSVGRRVAVKVHDRVLDTERDRRRFLREAAAAGRLSGHPHIVSLYDAGVTEAGRPYLLMELCPGGSLYEMIARDGALPVEDVLEVGIGVADALATAHERGILHRDVKPANLLLDAFGTVKLADFGLAAVLDVAGESSATLEGLTPAYASPEAFAMSPPTPQRDVYGLGATLYALLAGRPPRGTSWPPSSLSAFQAELRAPIAPIAGVPASLHAVLARALEPEPADRIQNAAELRDALRAIRHGQGGGGPVPPGADGGAPPAPSMSAGMPVPLSTRDRMPLPASTGDVTSAPSAAVTSAAPSAAVTSAAQAREAGQSASRFARSSHRRLSPLAIVVGALALVLAVVAVALALHRVGKPVATASRTPATAAAGAGAPTGHPTTGGSASSPSGTAPHARTGPPLGFTACPQVHGGFCPDLPQCWGGLVIISGVSVSARPVACDEPHYWETYAGGWLPRDLAGAPLDTIRRRYEVASVCSAENLARVAHGRIVARRWQREVLPQQVGQGDWVFHCVAAPAAGGERTGSVFG